MISFVILSYIGRKSTSSHIGGNSIRALLPTCYSSHVSTTLSLRKLSIFKYYYPELSISQKVISLHVRQDYYGQLCWNTHITYIYRLSFVNFWLDISPSPSEHTSGFQAFDWLNIISGLKSCWHKKLQLQNNKEILACKNLNMLKYPEK